MKVAFNSNNHTSNAFNLFSIYFKLLLVKLPGCTLTISSILDS